MQGSGGYNGFDGTEESTGQDGATDQGSQYPRQEGNAGNNPITPNTPYNPYSTRPQPQQPEKPYVGYGYQPPAPPYGQFGSPQPPYQPPYQQGYAPPSAPLSAPPTTPFGAYTPAPYRVSYAPPTPAKPAKQGMPGWAIALISVASAFLVLCLLLVICSAGINVLARRSSNNSNGGNGNNGSVFGAPTDTPYAFPTEYPTTTPYNYPTDTPVVYPTNTPVSFPLSNGSYDMQIGSGYGQNTNGYYVTGQTNHFRSDDPWAFVLTLQQQFPASQINYVLLKRAPNGSDSLLISQAQNITPGYLTYMWHGGSMGQLMGTEPPGQYEIRLTTSQYTYGYVDFNYYG